MAMPFHSSNSEQHSIWIQQSRPKMWLHFMRDATGTFHYTAVFSRWTASILPLEFPSSRWDVRLKSIIQPYLKFSDLTSVQDFLTLNSLLFSWLNSAWGELQMVATEIFFESAFSLQTLSHSIQPVGKLILPLILLLPMRRSCPKQGVGIAIQQLRLNLGIRLEHCGSKNFSATFIAQISPPKLVASFQPTPTVVA